MIYLIYTFFKNRTFLYKRVQYYSKGLRTINQQEYILMIKSVLFFLLIKQIPISTKILSSTMFLTLTKGRNIYWGRIILGHQFNRFEGFLKDHVTL